MKGKVSVLIDGRLRFSKKYNNMMERLDIMGQWKLDYAGRHMEFTIAPTVVSAAGRPRPKESDPVLTEPFEIELAKGLHSEHVPLHHIATFLKCSTSKVERLLVA